MKGDYSKFLKFDISVSKVHNIEIINAFVEYLDSLIVIFETLFFKVS